MTGRDITESQIIGSRIREVRVKKGMSQAELAVKANISLPHISDIELGKSRMMLASFVRITEALQVSADSLLRPDIPEVKNLYQSEFADILYDCTPAEIDSILKIVKELKATMHKKEEY
ncbi:helix-turn-helix domain-containing protein [uncultured Oscillibacter sp.]|uniref:helix-turn-helix domain-containing protein n=1 Tax=uncultured Oscillibacter sp. TaxID=876091 RepID=UPI0025FB9A9D|nr:helix-turn-helix transcriptional regulator [uncultured Oscillibacter sp.]